MVNYLVIVFYLCIGTIFCQNFSIIQLPDTQKYSENYPSIFYRQIEWIVENRDSLNIIFVGHVGDLCEHENSLLEYDRADSAFLILESAVFEGYNYGIPYSIVPGNHDHPTTLFNDYFGADRFLSRDYYGGCLSCPRNNNNYTFFSIADLEFMVISIDTHPHSNETLNQKLQWADSLLKAYPLKKTFIIGHWLLDHSQENSFLMNFSQTGKVIFDSLKHNNNLSLMMTGHVLGEGIKTELFEERTIHTILANYQNRINGGNGWLRLMKFFPENNAIEIVTYSPTMNSFENDGDSEATLFFDMGGVGSPPVITPIEKQVFQEDEILEIDISVFDEQNDSLSYEVSISDTNVFISVKNDIITVTPKHNWYGDARGLLSVFDGMFTTYSEFTLSINSVNDYPKINFDDIEMNMNASISISLPQTDADGDSLEYSINALDTIIIHEIIDDSILFITPMINWFGSSNVMLTISDGILLSFAEFKVEVFDDLLYQQSNDFNYFPLEFILYQNYPNPFNSFTSFEYDLPESGLVNITIYDMIGRKIKTLLNSSQAAGYKSIRWNATNDRNEPVSAGLYLYRIQAGKFRQTKKMVLLK